MMNSGVKPPTSAPSVKDYQSAIDRAVFESAANTLEARQALYERARTALTSQLNGQDLPNSQIAREMRLLNAAIRSVEHEYPYRLARKGSTTLLFLSILCFKIGWVTDFTCMSIYWVARLPKDLWKST
jgi:hypothetical protein